MEIFIKITQFILSFSLLIFIHELGHFLFARMFGIRVEKFYLFFNPWFSLVKFRIGQTEYGIGWIPFGGYVKIAGMIDESMDLDQMASEPKPDEFRSKPAWQRFLVMVGGVLMNVVLALVIYVGMTWAWGDRYIANEDLRDGWQFSEMAREIGFCNGDRILLVDGSPVENADMVYPQIVMSDTREVTVLRGGREVAVYIPPAYVSLMLDATDFMYPRMPFVAGGLTEDGSALKAGMEAGDSVVALDGHRLRYFDRFSEYLSSKAGESVEITVVRRTDGGAETELSFPAEVSPEGKLGIYPLPAGNFLPLRAKNYTFLQSIPEGARRMVGTMSGYWKQMKMVFKPETKAYKSLGGPIRIFGIFPDHWSWSAFWSLTALLSIVLAIMNILPIPGLDGGHVMFVLYEMITGRKPSDNFLAGAQMIGLLILFALIVFATSNDIRHLLK